MKKFIEGQVVRIRNYKELVKEFPSEKRGWAHVNGIWFTPRMRECSGIIHTILANEVVHNQFFENCWIIVPEMCEEVNNITTMEKTANDTGISSAVKEKTV